MVEKSESINAKLQFSHILTFNDEAGIQYILNSNSWLKILNDSKDLALVITGNLVGNFTFFIEKSNGVFENKCITFSKNGIYRLTHAPVKQIYLTTNALKIDKN